MPLNSSSFFPQDNFWCDRINEMEGMSKGRLCEWDKPQKGSQVFFERVVSQPCIQYPPPPPCGNVPPFLRKDHREKPEP